MSKEKKTARMTVPLLPLRDVIIFPHMVVPLFVGREKSINALEECVAKKMDLFLVAQRQATTMSPGEKDIFEIGTLGTILQILRLPDNTVKVLIEGKRRARIKPGKCCGAFPLQRLRHVPLVPRHGARDVRGPGDRGADE